jgi:iron complex outermembrane receptor protein
MRITTHTPDRTELTLDQTGALQSFSLYDTDNHYATSQTAVTAGGRTGALSLLLAGSFQISFSQMLAFATAASLLAGTGGAIPAVNKLGQPADLLGAAGLLHTRETQLLAHLDYDLTPRVAPHAAHRLLAQRGGLGRVQLPHWGRRAADLRECRRLCQQPLHAY